MQEGELAYFGRTKGTYKPLKPSHNFKRQKARVALFWGDPVYVIKLRGDRCTVSAKGHHLEIPRSHLRDTSLLSIYQIDCGQGDAALVHFPDDRREGVMVEPFARGASAAGAAVALLVTVHRPVPVPPPATPATTPLRATAPAP